jgi:hypothetical protein
VTPLAILKHISSKNADYGAAEAYLTYQHDEFTMKPTLDENGHLIPREDYRIAALNCGDEDFAVACMRSNLRYGKNQKREDVKSHHYIISFDPRDGPDNGLTVDRAQELGKRFCAEHFPGHQALVCTHPDGHNHAENIHVHIVINSLRIEDVPLLPHMDRPADRKAGCKHRCTDAAMNYFKAEVMEMCHREGLYQIDLLDGSRERVTEREYWAQRKGQAALDAAAADGIAPKQTKFETDKAKLRQTIRAALAGATSFDEFAALLLREGVTVKESRGRLSYLTPDRTKPITARRLGDDFDRAAILAALEQRAVHAAEMPTPISQPIPDTKDRPQRAKRPHRDGVQRLVDREAKRAEGKGVAYDRWASVHNLKQLSETYNFLTEHDLLDTQKLDKAVAQSGHVVFDKQRHLKEIENRLRERTDLRKDLLTYRRLKPLAQEYKSLSGKKRQRFYEDNQSELALYQSVAGRLSAQGKKVSLKALNAEIEALTSEKNAAYNEYRQAKDELRELTTIQANARSLYRQEPEQRRDRGQER